MTEQELVRAAAGGDTEAFERLVRTYENKIYHLALRMCGSADEAADIAQEAFLAAWRGLPSFRGDSGFATWLYRLTSNAAIDYLRRQERFSRLLVDEGQMPDIPDEADIAEAGSQIPEEVLMGFVAELPEGCRTVFNLYVFEEKSHKEIADLLHIKEHSSTSQLHRAKCMLAKRIKAYLAHERQK